MIFHTENPTYTSQRDTSMAEVNNCTFFGPPSSPPYTLRLPYRMVRQHTAHIQKTMTLKPRFPPITTNFPRPSVKS